MTIEELANQTGQFLADLTDKELDTILRPMYAVTRPELAPRHEKKTDYQQPLSAGQIAVAELLKEEGMDINFLFKKKKKK